MKGTAEKMTRTKSERNRTVYSTNPDFKSEPQSRGEPATLPAAQQNLKIWLDKKQRNGKIVTLITGFVGSGRDLHELARALKTRCGVGGTIKDGEILMQGDLREKVIAILSAVGYRVKRAGG